MWHGGYAVQRHREFAGPMLIRHLCAGAVLALVPLQQGAWQTRTYVPPGEPGYIYTVIQPGPSAAPAEPVTIAVSWGAWRQTGRVAAPPGQPPMQGVVLRLRHSKWDRHPVTVSTTGIIVSGPVQGTPPPQWVQQGYRRVIW
jgi:hypothetical protein